MNKFLKSVGEIDDDLLDRYESIEKNLVPKKRRSSFLKIAVIAACFCLIFGSLFAVLHFDGEPELPNHSGIASDIESKPSKTESDSGDESDREQSEFDDNISNAVSDNESVNSETSDNETSNGETSNGETSTPDNPPVGHNVIHSNEPLWLNPSVASGSQGGGGQSAEPVPWKDLFSYGMTAVGRVKEIFPDTYARIGASPAGLRYRVVVMEISEAVYGKNLPDEIYLMIPSYLDAEALLNYDEMLFAFKQKGFENYVLANETKKRAEAFSMMFETVPGFPEFCFVPFTDGVFDISLWREKGFNHYFYTEEYMYEFFTNSEVFPVQIGDTFEQAKKTILDTYAELRYPPLDRVLYSNVFNFDAAKEILEYCKPFENGVFAQEAYVQSTSAIFFERYIYGFATNEMIRISDKNGDVTYYGEAFTEDEIKKLPNIADFFDNYDISSLSPEHTVITEKHTVGDPKISGNYIKYNGTVYSVARVAWKIVDDRNWYCNDDTYFLISEDGSATVIDREELRELTGDDEFITNFEYNVYEEIEVFE